MKRVVLLSALAVAVGAGPHAQTPQPAAPAKPARRSTSTSPTPKAARRRCSSRRPGRRCSSTAAIPGERDLTRIMAMLERRRRQADSTTCSPPTTTSTTSAGCRSWPSGSRSPTTSITARTPSRRNRSRTSRRPTSSSAARPSTSWSKPGDRVPITGLDWRIVTSAGAGAEDGAARRRQAESRRARQFEKRPDPATPDDNAASVGSVVTYGQFRLIDLGDLLWNKEGELMCPNNPVGTVDLFMVTHHGLAQSNPDALVQGVRPRVALDAERHAQRRRGPGVREPAQVARLRGRLAAALVLQRRHRAQRARRVHRQRRRPRDDCRRADRAAGAGRGGGGGGGAPGGGRRADRVDRAARPQGDAAGRPAREPPPARTPQRAGSCAAPATRQVRRPQGRRRRAPPAVAGGNGARRRVDRVDRADRAGRAAVAVAGAVARRPRTRRRTTSRFLRRPTARSPSPTRGTASARPTRKRSATDATCQARASERSVVDAELDRAPSDDWRPSSRTGLLHR